MTKELMVWSNSSLDSQFGWFAAPMLRTTVAQTWHHGSQMSTWSTQKLLETTQQVQKSQMPLTGFQGFDTIEKPFVKGKQVDTHQGKKLDEDYRDLLEGLRRSTCAVSASH